jgi:glycerol-3-phosphate dehydrogenase
MPALNPDILCTATYYDASISYPERLCMELLFDGEELCPDARAVNYVSLDSASGDTVVLRDALSDATVEVKPRMVVNATGAWIDFTNRRMGLETRMIGGTKGAHLVLDNPKLARVLGDKMLFYETPDGRVSITFVWLGKAMIGSTDIRCEDPDTAVCDDDETDYMINAIQTAFPDIRVDRSQVLSNFSGVRPLANKEAATTGQITRAHACTVLEPGEAVSFPVYCLVGGKWTPFRAFASDVADGLLASLGRVRRADSTDLAIGGGKDYPGSETARQRWVADLGARTGLPAKRVEVLLERYGTRAERVAAFLVDGEDEPLKNHAGFTRREVEFMVRHERVMHLDDILLRRTAIALTGELTDGLLRELAELVAPLLAWSAEQVQQELRRTARILNEKHGIRTTGVTAS